MGGQLAHRPRPLPPQVTASIEGDPGMTSVLTSLAGARSQLVLGRLSRRSHERRHRPYGGPRDRHSEKGATVNGSTPILRSLAARLVSASIELVLFVPTGGWRGGFSA